MPGILTIAKNEFMDHVSDRTFLLSFAILLIAMIAGALYQVQFVRDWTFLVSPTAPHVMAEGAGWKFFDTFFTEFITGPLSLLGVLVAISLIFNSINKERTKGSLKILLSYPIHRDQIILGKLIAGFIVITTVTIASLVIGFTLYLFSITVSFSPDLIMRFSAFTIMSVLLISDYLGMSMLFSIAFKDSKTVLLAMFLLIGLFNSQASLSLSLIHI